MAETWLGLWIMRARNVSSASLNTVDNCAYVLLAVSRSFTAIYTVSQKNIPDVFTALHAMQTRSSDENSVRLSVRLSVYLSVHHTRALWQNGRKICPDLYIPYERTFILVFWEKKWLVGGDPFYVKFWVNRPPLERNRRFSTNNRS